MKTTLSRLIACLLVFASCAMTAGAATLQWSVNLGPAPVMQLISDGSGGCAVASQDVGGYTVTWYDNKGGVRYTKTAIPAAPILIACQKNGVVFCYQDGGFYRVITVDKKGTESITGAPGEHYVDYPAVAFNRSVQRRSDSKGYFVERVAGPSTTLQRYSYK